MIDLFNSHIQILSVQKLILSFALLACLVSANAQLSQEQLNQAAHNGGCGTIAKDLKKTELKSEQMKFDAGICLYQNGDIEKAMALFREVYELKAGLHQSAKVWEAKCLARLGNDQLAMEALKSIPLKILNRRIILDPAFTTLENNNEQFLQLRSKLMPHFNFWTVLLSAIACIGFLAGLLLIFGKSKFSAGENWMAITVLSTSCTLISYVLIWTGYSQDFPYLVNAWQFLILLIGPSLLFYLRTVFGESISKNQLLWHFIYPVLTGLASVIPLAELFNWNLRIPLEIFEIFTSPFLLSSQVLIYTILIFRYTHNEWQVDDNIRVWTRIIAWGMLAFAIAFLSYFVLVRTSFFNSQWDYAISLVMALGILTITYMGLVQRRVFSSEPIGKFLPVKKYYSSNLTHAASASIRKGLTQLLEEEKVFKETELRLNDLAAYLNINRHQLSQVINEQYGMNFYELINRYRINYIRQQLNDPNNDKLTIIQLAYEAGFNNKASFNRYFKKLTGMTPSAYRLKSRHQHI